MTAEARVINVEDIPELARIVEEVARTGQRCVVRKDNADIAVIARPPVRRVRRRRPRVQWHIPTEEEIQLALQQAGAWKDIDTEKLKQELFEAQSDDRPPVNW